MTGPLELLDAVESLGLLSGVQSSGLRAEWSSTSGMSASDAARRLVERRVLTSFQADRLLDGDGRSLVVQGRYHLRELLGAGGMGQVYLARDAELGRDVAIKVLPPHLVRDEGAVARFRREAKAMARLAHPNIVQAFDAGADGDRQFLIMEHVEGANLSHILKHGGALEPAAAADYAYQAALALDHAHQKGVVHRDFKPGNVLVTRHRQVKVLDLGLARFLQDQIDDETLTQEGNALGTPDYMAPEQFGQARHADERSDVYALGCTLYHMLAGHVPFPGSSYAEKWKAHQRAEPEPIEATSPNVPAGLAQAVARMMAKRPQDRFTSARECAEALLPYVAASSASLPDLRATASWQGGQLTLMTAPQRRRRVMKWAALAASFILLGTAAGFGLSRLRDGEAGRSPGRGDDSTDALAAQRPPSSPLPPGGGSGRGGESTTAPDDTDSPPAPAETDPWVLTVSQDPKDGGEYRSINDALKAVKPGMTVRVLDGAKYEDPIVIDDPERYRGVTLETTAGAGLGRLEVVDVTFVTVRGFRLLSSETVPMTSLITLSGLVEGGLLDRLVFADLPKNMNAILIRNAGYERGQSPIVVQGCRIEGHYGGRGIAVLGAPPPAKRGGGVCIRANRIARLSEGIKVTGFVQDVQVVANLVTECSNSGLDLTDIAQDAARVLVANNTMSGCLLAVRFVDNEPHESPQPGQVAVAGNLFLDSKTAHAVYARTTRELSELSPVDARELTEAWRFEANWQDSSGTEARQFFPFVEGKDHLLTGPRFVSAERGHADFLRPAADSPLATEGAGKVDPSLPRYVGALPPAGVDPWDWDRTWLASPGTSELLTVSEEPEKGGQHRTITDALAAAKPWATIRVLDDAEYSDPITLDDPERHRGLMLETTAGAKLRRVEINGVPHVVLRGFRVLSAPHARGAVIMIKGAAEGVRLERLEMPKLSDTTGIAVLSADIPADATPVIIERCHLMGDLPARGIMVAGAAPSAAPTGRVRVLACIFETLGEGLELNRALTDVQVLGNLFRGCTMSAIELDNIGSASRAVLIANNSTVASSVGLQIVDNPPYEEPATGNGEIVANVFLDSRDANVGIVRVSDRDGNLFGIDPATTIKAWAFGTNWQDQAEAAAYAVPSVAGKLATLTSWPFESRDPNDPASTRPKLDSPLATGGAGGDLPPYAGATPPTGVEPWDWNITWRSRSRRFTG